MNGMKCLCSHMIPSVHVLILQMNCDRLSPWAACTLDLSHLFITERVCISILGDNQNLTRHDPEQSDLILTSNLTSKRALLWAGIGLDVIGKILLMEIFLWVSWCVSIYVHANKYWKKVTPWLQPKDIIFPENISIKFVIRHSGQIRE